MIKNTEELSQLGSEYPDLIIDIFDALRTGSNDEFREEIRRLERDYERGQPLTWRELMEFAESIYNDFIDKGTWNKKDPRDERIMALATIIQNMEKNNVAYTSTASSGNSAGYTRNNPKNHKFRPIPGWKLVPPSNLSETKDINEKTYYWCPHHWEKGMWALHKPSDCRSKNHTPKQYNLEEQKKLFANTNGTTTKNSDTSSQEITPSFKLNDKLQMAMTALSEGNNNFDSSFLANYGLDSDTMDEKESDFHVN